VNSPVIREWLAANPIGIEDGLRHDKWCAMMWPRLRLLRELLAETGSLWMTIDKYEFDNAIQLLTEIFGRENILATITTEANPRGRQSDKYFATVNDYLICVAKDQDEIVLNGVLASQVYVREFNRFDENGKAWRELGLRQRGADSLRSDREYMFFPIYVNPDDGSISLESGIAHSIKVVPLKSDGREGRWSWSPSYVKSEISRVYGRLVRGHSGTERFDIFYRDFLERNGFERLKKPRTIWPASIANNESGGLDLKQFALDVAFQYPKPVRLIAEILQIATSATGVVFDSFSGSGTTAQAVLESNKRDNGARRFILVEMENYADKLTAERMRRVINGYEFKGTQKTELFRVKLNWRTIEKAANLVHKVEGVENLEAHRFDRIVKQVKDGELIVTGEKTVAERAEGLGGSFTYCSLGPPVELDKILTGETLPAYGALGSALFHMATNRACDPTAIRQADFYLGATEGQRLWLIYKPDLDWLKSPDAALTLSRARAFAETDKDKRHLVFAPSRFVSQKVLADHHLPVEFVPLPFALYRIERT